MKIIQITPFYLPSIGGVETHVSELNQKLLEAGHEIHVLTNQKETPVLLEEEIDGVFVQRLPKVAFNHKWQTWKWMWSQRDLLFAADVIQVHDIFWWVYPLLPMIEDKVFTTFHGWEGKYPVPFKNKVHRWLASAFSRKTIHVGDWIKEFYWDKPTAVTYGGIHTKPKILKPLSAKMKEIVFFGRLSTDNDVKKYIELVKLLKTQLNKFEMIWVGDGPLAAECRKVGKVTGLVDNPIKYLEKADLVFSSSYLSMLQAQALGKIVCAFYSHRLKERYIETYPGVASMLVSSTPEDMTAQLMSLSQNQKKLQLMSWNAHSLARKQTWDKVVELYLKLWKV